MLLMLKTNTPNLHHEAPRAFTLALDSRAKETGLNKAIKFIGELFLWLGYALLSCHLGGTSRKWVSALLVQPVLLQSLSIECSSSLLQKGTVYTEHPFPSFLNTKSEHLLAQSLGDTDHATPYR